MRGALWKRVALAVGVAALSLCCQRGARTGEVPAAAAPAAAAPTPGVALPGKPPGAGPAVPVTTGAEGAPGSTTAKPSRVVVQLTEAGFVPSHIPAQVGTPVTLAITRKTDKTCAREILFKGQPGKTDLPLGKEVEVTYTPKVSGAVPFGCAMGMMVAGVLEVR